MILWFSLLERCSPRPFASLRLVCVPAGWSRGTVLLLIQVITNNRAIEHKRERQHKIGQVGNADLTIKISFANPQIQKPQQQDENGNFSPLYPHEARLRQMNYTCQLFVDVKVTKIEAHDNGQVKEPQHQVSKLAYFLSRPRSHLQHLQAQIVVLSQIFFVPLVCALRA